MAVAVIARENSDKQLITLVNLELLTLPQYTSFNPDSYSLIVAAALPNEKSTNAVVKAVYILYPDCTPQTFKGVIRNYDSPKS
jgi:hypothetical protein